MHALLAAATFAQRRGGGLNEFGRDPLLTLACIVLIVVCVLWILLARLITRNLDRAARTSGKKVDEIQPPRDIWRDPP